MYKIAAIGDGDSMMAFRAFGINTVAVKEPHEAARAMRKLSEDSAVIFVTEEIAEQIPKEIDRYKEQIAPAVILIPSGKGSKGIGLQAISTAVERAVGVDIFHNEE